MFWSLTSILTRSIRCDEFPDLRRETLRGDVPWSGHASETRQQAAHQVLFSDRAFQLEWVGRSDTNTLLAVQPAHLGLPQKFPAI